VNAGELPAGGRFTAYLPMEREALQALAGEEGSSENYLVRISVRALLGLPIPRHYRELLERNLEGGSLEAAEKAAA
jgi:hypothetical protein